MAEEDRLRVAAAVISLIALIGVAYLARPVLQRGGQLANHLQSGSWAVEGGNKPVDAALLALYPQPSDEWQIAYLAGSARSYPLDDARRAETINDLGDYLYSSEVVARRTSTRLSSQYASLVDRAVRGKGISRTTWGDARKSLDDFRNDLGPQFESFPVDTSPASDSLAEWNAKPVQLPQSSRCLGTVRGYRSNETIAADIAIHPRYRMLPFDRPWFRPALLDEASKSPDAKLKAMVTGDGPLAEIPEALLVILPDGVRLRTNRNSVAALDALNRSGDCCRIECLGVSFDLEAGSGTPMTDGSILGRRNSPEPFVYALISRRRPQ